MGAGANATVAVCTRGTDAALLRGCLESVFAQRPPPEDVLVVDNGGGAAASLRGVFGPRLRVVNEPRVGAWRARNRAIADASGEIIAFLDDDVRAEPGWLTAISAVFAEPEVLAAGGPISPVWEEPPPAWLLSSSRALGTQGLLDLGPVRRDIDPQREFFVGGNLACRRAAVRGSRGFLPVWPCSGLGAIADDYELSRRLAREGRAVYEPAAATRHLIARGKTRWGHVLRRAYAAEAARTCLGGRLDSSRAAAELRGAKALVAAAVFLGHVRARLSGYRPEPPSEEPAR